MRNYDTALQKLETMSNEELREIDFGVLRYVGYKTADNLTDRYESSYCQQFDSFTGHARHTRGSKI